MCGIIGFFGFSDSKKRVEEGLRITKNRGKENTSLIKVNSNSFIGHNLHSIVSFVKQPLSSKKGILVTNCEIYNWKELAKKYHLKVKNDAELLLKLFDLKGIQNANKIIQELDGDFAIAYYEKKQKKLVLCRDFVGVKPLVFFHDGKKFAFASEKKALNLESIHLNPRHLLLFDSISGKVVFKKTGFFNQKTNSSKKNIQKNVENIENCKKLLFSSVMKRIPNKKFGLLLSGGLDSALIGKILSLQKKQGKIKFDCYFSYVDSLGEPKDLSYAIEVSKNLQQKLIIEKVSLEEFEKKLPEIISIIESTDPIRVGVASTIFFATRNASKNGNKVIFSGVGADELFAGYSRFKNSNQINKDCYSYLIKLYENDLYFQDLICMYNNIELRVPFLDKELVNFALNLDEKFKINNEMNKVILRNCAILLGLPELIAYRKKCAAQYGSNFDKALEVLAKKNGFKSKADYLNNIGKKISLKTKNIKIGALISTGKDSLYAMSLMKKQGYEISCLITIESTNKDSFMYHTPTTKLSKIQAKALNLPLIVVKTSGEKERELKDLEKAILKAKTIHKIEGVCSGALFSNYQRDRIEKICEKAGIRSFTPLWHFEQKNYMKLLVKSGFEVIITKIACYGLNEKWLGRRIDENAINELFLLEKKFGINVAGEGGEYETLVVDCPLFEKKILIESAEKRMQNEFTGELIIKKAKLIEKDNAKL